METVDYRIKIKNLPEEMRPRERLAREGPQALSAVELLAVLLRTGTSTMSALDLATVLLTRLGGLEGLAAGSPEELCQVTGVGPAKAAQIRAAVELGRRLAEAKPRAKKVIQCPADIYNLLKDNMRRYDREHFKVVFLNTKHHVIDVETVSVGSLNSSIVHPRELFRNSIKRSAAALILVHNHPSGDPAPSPEDIDITRRLAQAGELIGIQVLDHVIIGCDGFISLKEKGII